MSGQDVRYARACWNDTAAVRLLGSGAGTTAPRFGAGAPAGRDPAARTPIPPRPRASFSPAAPTSRPRDPTRGQPVATTDRASPAAGHVLVLAPRSLIVDVEVTGRVHSAAADGFLWEERVGIYRPIPSESPLH